jgi:hypothetical protein
MRRLLTTLLLTLSLLVPTIAVAGFSSATRHAGSQKAGAKAVHVKGYTKKDGTKVKAHDRKASDGTTRAKTASKPKQPAVSRARDSRGRFVRSAEAKRQFMHTSGYPHGRPGYVVDHIYPLACGGADAPSNMQWQTTADAKAKDKVERHGCR